MDIKLEEKLQERNKDLIQALKPCADRMENEWNANFTRKKPLRLGSTLTQNIYTALTKYPLMSMNEYNMLDEIDLETYYQYYMQFISTYSLFEVANTKQLFCAYMRITVSKFNYLMEKSDNENLKEYANYINDNINGLIYASAETGNTDSRSALTRGKIKKDGQNLVEVREEVSVQVSQAETPEQLMARANKIFLESAKK